MRMNGHRSDIMTRKIDRQVAAHFCQPDHSLENLQVMRKSIKNALNGDGREKVTGFLL